MQIYFLENRKVDIYGEPGINEEHNAEQIHFHFPEKIAGINISELNIYLNFKVLNSEEKINPKLIINNILAITNDITKHERIECQIVFKKENNLLAYSNIFSLNFDKNLPFEYQIDINDLDIIDSLINQYKELNDYYKNSVGNIDEIEKKINDLKIEIEKSEEERNENEQKRIEIFDNLEKKLLEAINTIKDLKELYNENATEKTENFNINYNNKTKDFNDNVAEKINKFESFYNSKILSINNATTQSLSSIFNAKDNVINLIKQEKESSIKEIENKIEELVNAINLKENYRYEVIKPIDEETEITLDFNYKVGELEVFYCGERLIRNEDYEEVFTEGEEISNKIKILFDVPVSEVFPRYFDFVVKGGIENA